MIGNFERGKYRNGYGNEIKCFVCNSNECNGSKSFPLLFGGNGELTHCQEHENDVKSEVQNRINGNTTANFNQSHS